MLRYRVVVISSDVIETAGRRLAAAAREPARVLLFGSHARGDAGPDSDLDFLVIERDVPDRHAEMVRLEREVRSLGVPIDVLVVSEAYAAEWADVRNSVVHAALNEGREFAADVKAPEFAAQAYRQALAVATSEHDADDQAFVDAISSRPVVILQDDRFDATASIPVCPFTTNPVEAPLLRLPIEPTDENGLDEPSQLMIDRITTVPRASLGGRLGRLRDDQLIALNRSSIVFLGLASAPQT